MSSAMETWRVGAERAQIARFGGDGDGGEEVRPPDQSTARDGSCSDDLWQCLAISLSQDGYRP
jgi:hypothetical protein